MDTIKGIYAAAEIYTVANKETAVDEYALAQIKMICDNRASESSKICLMPDVHPGKIGPVGFTMTVGARVLPGLVGIDIGCGMSIVKIKAKKLEGQQLDKVIRERVPAGFDVRDKVHHMAEDFDFSRLRCGRHVRKEKALLSLGSLGSGNHFIEIDKDDDKNLYMVVHTGSRHLGKEVADFYMAAGQKLIKEKGEDVPYEMTYLEGELLSDYLHDLLVVQEYAELNRQIIISEIAKGMKWKIEESYSCIHNYIDEDKVLRKGAISAKEGEAVIIPINMKEGILLGTGMGNPSWNCSAPHGAGRILKRDDVKSRYTVADYKAQMKGIYSSCISKSTLDEAPFAYRALADIADAIKDTVNIDKIIKPCYNFKAGGKE